MKVTEFSPFMVCDSIALVLMSSPSVIICSLTLKCTPNTTLQKYLTILKEFSSPNLAARLSGLLLGCLHMFKLELCDCLYELSLSTRP